MSNLQDALVKLGKQRRGKVTAAKAREMLSDGTAHGKPLTDKQRRWLYWQSGDDKGYKKVK